MDSVLAQDIYQALTEKGYRTFFARITLEDVLGREYEPYIFAALNSAKVMLCVGTDYEYFNAVWVRNEWSRFLKMMEKDKAKHLIPCYKGIDAYDIPKEFNKLQAQDLGKVGTRKKPKDVKKAIAKLETIRGFWDTDKKIEELKNQAAIKYGTEYEYGKAMELRAVSKPALSTKGIPAYIIIENV